MHICTHCTHVIWREREKRLGVDKYQPYIAFYVHSNLSNWSSHFIMLYLHQLYICYALSPNDIFICGMPLILNRVKWTVEFSSSHLFDIIMVFSSGLYTSCLFCSRVCILCTRTAFIPSFLFTQLHETFELFLIINYQNERWTLASVFLFFFQKKKISSKFTHIFFSAVTSTW